MGLPARKKKNPAVAFGEHVCCLLKLCDWVAREEEMASGQDTVFLVAFPFWMFFVRGTSHSQKQLFLQGLARRHLFLVEAGGMSEVMFEFSVLL